MLSFKGVDNASYYRLDARRAAVLHGLHGHGQLAQPGAPVGAAADHGLAALLRHRVPRRRLPLRPRVGARARVLRRRPPLGVLRHHPPGSGALAGEADRRAVGRRPGRLPGRQLPGALGRVERDVPRHDARLLARRRRTSPSSRRGSPARATSTSPTAARRSRRSTSSPRTTASRCAISSRTTRSTTRRTSRTTSDGTDDNRSWNCGVEGETDDPGGERAARAAAAQLPRDAAALAGRADAARRRRARAHAARQQQRVVPGQRDVVVRLGGGGRGAARVHAAADPAAARASGLPPLGVPHGTSSARLGAARRLVVPARRPPDDADATGSAATGTTLGVFLNGAEIPSRTPHGEAIVDDSFLVLFNASPETVDVHAADAPLRLGVDGRAGDGRRSRRRASSARARRSACRTARWCCSGARRLSPCASISPARCSRRTSATFSSACAARLRAEGFDVFVPHEEALALDNTPADVIFAKDYAGLHDADAVLAVLDGPQTDDGTACEIGIFYALMQSRAGAEGNRRAASPTCAARAAAKATASTSSSRAASRRRARSSPISTPRSRRSPPGARDSSARRRRRGTRAPRRRRAAARLCRARSPRSAPGSCRRRPS